jgi:hypothetical protein
MSSRSSRGRLKPNRSAHRQIKYLTEGFEKKDSPNISNDNTKLVKEFLALENEGYNKKRVVEVMLTQI